MNKNYQAPGMEIQLLTLKDHITTNSDVLLDSENLDV